MERWTLGLLAINLIVMYNGPCCASTNYINPSQIPTTSACLPKQPFPDPDKTGPPHIKTNTRSFSAMYEFMNRTTNDEGFANPILYEENYDQIDGVYSYQVYGYGQHANIIERDSTNQAYHIQQSYSTKGHYLVCETKSPSSMVKFLQGPTRLSIHGNHTYYLQQLLSIDPKFSQGYFGTMHKEDNDRGLEADRWEYCLENYMVRVVIYWSKKSANVKTQNPLWIEIYFPGHNSSEVVNIFTFKRDEISKRALITPPGVYCPGRKSIQNKSLPLNFKKMAAFRFKSELIQTPLKEVTWENHWYDFNYNYRRIDHEVSIHNNYTSSDTVYRVSDIIQYELKKGYRINRDTGECKVHYDIGFFKEYGIFQSINTADFTSPHTLFGSENEKYIYIGQDNIRGIDCDVYQTLRKGLPIDVGSSSVAVSELYIPIKGMQEPPTPVAMRLTPYNHTNKRFPLGASYLYYFYDWYYYGNQLDFNAFDLTDCFSDKDKRDVYVEFDLSVEEKTLSDIKGLIYSPMFLFKVRETAAQMTGLLDFLHITNVRCYIDTDTYSVYGLFTVLGVHPQMRNLPTHTQTLTEALKILARNINQNKFHFEVLHHKKTLRVAAFSSLKSLIGLALPTFTKPTHRTTKAVKPTSHPTTPKKVTYSTPAKTTAKPSSAKPSQKPHTPTTPIPTTPNPMTPNPTTPKSSKVKGGNENAEKPFTPGVIGGAAVGSLLGGLSIGGIVAFLQIRFMNGKVFGVQVI